MKQKTSRSKVVSIKILTSLIGYGVYFPAKITYERLKAAGFDAELLIFEKLYTPDKKKLFQESKVSFGKNYRLAQLATKIPVDYMSSTDTLSIDQLYQDWDKNDTHDFLCFSGLWFNVLKNYKPKCSAKNVKCCRMDAGDAYTWSNRSHLEIDHSYYFFQLTSKAINFTFNIPDLKHSMYSARPNNVVVHGGGWGLGNFIGKTKAIENKGFRRNIIISDLDDYQEDQENSSFHINDPSWDPLNNELQLNTFPKLGKITNNKKIAYRDCPPYHAVLDLINHSKAVISKPGGMTLVDSLITATPLIYLEPMGSNEQGNKSLIEYHKIGISFDAWEQADFSPQLLTTLHLNLIKLKAHLPDFASTFIRDMNSSL